MNEDSPEEYEDDDFFTCIYCGCLIEEWWNIFREASEHETITCPHCKKKFNAQVDNDPKFTAWAIDNESE